MCDRSSMDDEIAFEAKRRLRRSLRAQRRETYGGEAGSRRREQEAQALLRHAQPLLDRIGALCAARPTPPVVAAFHPTPTEVDVLPLARAFARLGAQLIFPAAAGKELQWITWDGHSPFIDSPGKGFGKEPQGTALGPAALAGAALVLAPAVAIDRAGTRLGHGAGYYDRALGHRDPVTGPAGLVGVVHPAELLAAGSLPREPHDVPIPTVLTAAGLVDLLRGDGHHATRQP